MWWVDPEEGRLLVLSRLPSATTSNDYNPCGSLAPGTTVVGTELWTMDARTLQVLHHHPSDSRNTATGSISSIDAAQVPKLQVLKIESPLVGYVVYAHERYGYLMPIAGGGDDDDDRPNPAAGPSRHHLHHSADPAQPPLWRVTCAAGAFVRKGLDLSTQHLCTLPRGSLVYVHRKTVNSMGLARLQISALSHCKEHQQHILPQHRPKRQRQQHEEGGSNDDSTTAPSTATAVEGWCSEFLNPLSGQRGPVVQPVPFSAPVRYRVVLPQGAVIRSGVELSSPPIGHAPYRAVVYVTARRFSQHPMDRCVERLRLAGGGDGSECATSDGGGGGAPLSAGWISLRINREPPNDDPVVELMDDTDSSSSFFDPDRPEYFHLKALERVRRKQRQQLMPSTTTSSSSQPGDTEPMVLTDISSIDENENDDGDTTTTRSSSSSSSAQQCQSQQRPEATTPVCSYMVGTSGIDAGGSSKAAAAVAQLSLSVSDPGHRRRRQQHQRRQSLPSYHEASRNGATTNTTCLICLCEDRNATLVHGETGHVATCLMCARILKARGDPCPVCRLPIDLVIQQFWA